MATTDVHQARVAVSPPLFLLPVVLLVVLFGVGVLLAQVAPSRVTSGVYQVIVGDYAAVIPTESLTCGRSGDTATCTTQVGGRQLTIDVYYAGTPEPGPCTARHGDRPVSCQPVMGNYGHISQTVWITDELGLSSAELADLDDAAPWWRATDELTTAMLILIGTLAAVAGASTFLLYRRFRPVRPSRRPWLIAGTGVAASACFGVTGLLFAPPQPVSDTLAVPLTAPLMFLAPFSLFAAGVMAIWQWQLVGARGGRVVTSVVAACVVAFYTGVSMLVFLIQSGFDD